MCAQPLFAFPGDRQIRKCSLEICLTRGIGAHLQQEARDRIVNGHQHAVTCPRCFEIKPWGESEWVQEPAARWRVKRKPRGNDSLFQRRGKPRKRTWLCGTQSRNVWLLIHRG